eukprot:TRINITY_DN11368_c0_g1_i1.p1 TRINITY_DN11368_c0_g1~~TRINITY_DN11368_c0_g1_i1.p1  ORF type:complete len:456 (-),score=70.44 TRINITY_DN11368_c0_g1_i1:219-1586(-)
MLSLVLGRYVFSRKPAAALPSSLRFAMASLSSAASSLRYSDFCQDMVSGLHLSAMSKSARLSIHIVKFHDGRFSCHLSLPSSRSRVLHGSGRGALFCPSRSLTTVTPASEEQRPRLWGDTFLARPEYDDWVGVEGASRAGGSHGCRSSLQDEVSSSVETVASLIDGKAIADQIRAEIAEEVTKMKAEADDRVPGLAVVLVGARKDSQTYVRMKKKACDEAGIGNFGVDMPEDATEEEVLAVVEGLNADPRVHGILVQLPLPKHMNEEKVLSRVSLKKDVDGFHPLNMGRLAMMGREPLFVPCTPKGCIELLLRSGVDLDGKRVAVLGRSNVVGMPAALLAQRCNATVTVVHSHTADPAAVTREADVVIAAVGRAGLVRGSWLKPGAVVIDVGINPVEDPESKRGYRLVGDVAFEEARHVASAITPVPGGVGPMTIAMLLSNTLLAAKRSFGLISS